VRDIDTRIQNSDGHTRTVVAMARGVGSSHQRHTFLELKHAAKIERDACDIWVRGEAWESLNPRTRCEASEQLVAPRESKLLRCEIGSHTILYTCHPGSARRLIRPRRCALFVQHHIDSDPLPGVAGLQVLNQERTEVSGSSRRAQQQQEQRPIDQNPHR
jgi:hypothetical protein